MSQVGVIMGTGSNRYRALGAHGPGDKADVDPEDVRRALDRLEETGT